MKGSEKFGSEKIGKASLVGRVDSHGKSIGKQSTSAASRRRSSSQSQQRQQRSKSKSKSAMSLKTQSSLTPKGSQISYLDNCSKLKTYDDAWTLFKCEEIYDEYQIQLSDAANVYKISYDDYNELLKKIQCTTEKLDAKKEYKTKVCTLFYIH